MNDNKQKALDAALSQIERQFGKGSIMKLGDNKALNIESVSTGSLGIDIALGIGGLPWDVLLKCMVLSHLVKQRLLYKLSQKLKKKVKHVPLLMLSML